MRELALESRECNVCGSRGQVARGGSGLGARCVSPVERLDDGRLVRAPRVRSRLAHTAGYAGVLYLFGRSVVPLAASHWWVESGAFFLLGLGLNLPPPPPLVCGVAGVRLVDR